MPAHGLPPDEHRRRIAAVCQALAEGCAPPSIHVTYGPKRAKARALEILNAGSARPLSGSAFDAYLFDYPFPWPVSPGEKPKLTRDYLAGLGLEAKADPATVAPQGVGDLIEAVEDPSLLALRDADPRIFNAHLQPRARILCLACG